jgi:2-oxoisovalerate dehydrogenase E1 component
VSLLGEDLEDPKGDIFGLTRGLSRDFPGRVINSALSEATIVGVAIGRALAGERPVAFLQFADFIPLAFNQIHSELGSLHWRTAGAWPCAAIVMAASGAYRPGLGPFHAQTLESVLAHVPGIDVLMPSDPADAAGLLNAAFESGRPTIFLYPKALLNDRDLATAVPVARHVAPIGRARPVRRGGHLTMVSWGGTVGLCRRAAEHLEAVGVGVDLLDLRSISPWDRDGVIASARRTGRLLVVHEDNLTCGFGAEVLAAAAEAVGPGLHGRRVTRPDTFLPCHFPNQLEILPSLRGILGAAADLVGLELAWDAAPARDGDEDMIVVKAIGSSPADQSVTVVSWRIRPGDEVHAGQAIAELEADKAVFELSAPVRGRIESILVPEGRPVRVGTDLLRLNSRGECARPSRLRPERSASPRLRRRQVMASSDGAANVARSGSAWVGLSAPSVATGSDRLANEQLVAEFPGTTEAEIIRRTGVEVRCRASPRESAVGLAVDACRLALARAALSLQDIDALICSTTTPPFLTPSTACLILHALCERSGPHEIPAFDLNAGCAGFLYALASAFDMVQSRPEARVLVVTTDVMSRAIDPRDRDAVALFGDAASATLLMGLAAGARAWAGLHRPVLSARGEDGRLIRLGGPGPGWLRMAGREAAEEAAARMGPILAHACDEAVLVPDELRFVVPHLPTELVAAGLRNALGLDPSRVFGRIGRTGYAGSTALPLGLSELAREGHLPGPVGLVGFGGGFAYGAAILRPIDDRPEDPAAG